MVGLLTEPLTVIHILETTFWEALSQTPNADLNILDLQRNNLDLAFVTRTSEAVNAFCIFVRDSGDESALA